MKRIIIQLTLVLLIGQSLTAQDSILPRRFYKTRITLLNGSIHKGHLGFLSDSSLLTGQYPVALQAADHQRYQLQPFGYAGLQEIRIQRKASVGRGVLFGLLTGLLLSFVAGIEQGSNNDRQFLIRNIFGAGFGYYTIKGTMALQKG